MTLLLAALTLVRPLTTTSLNSSCVNMLDRVDEIRPVGAAGSIRSMTPQAEFGIAAPTIEGLLVDLPVRDSVGLLAAARSPPPRTRPGNDQPARNDGNSSGDTLNGCLPKKRPASRLRIPALAVRQRSPAINRAGRKRSRHRRAECSWPRPCTPRRRPVRRCPWSGPPPCRSRPSHRRRTGPRCIVCRHG